MFSLKDAGLNVSLVPEYKSAGCKCLRASFALSSLLSPAAGRNFSTVPTGSGRRDVAAALAQQLAFALLK